MTEYKSIDVGTVERPTVPICSKEGSSLGYCKYISATNIYYFYPSQGISLRWGQMVDVADVIQSLNFQVK